MVSDAIRLKRAVRKFTPDPLPEETTLAILNAGRRAQSSKNTENPWRRSISELITQDGGQTWLPVK
jgi:nitroreductase